MDDAAAQSARRLIGREREVVRLHEFLAAVSADGAACFLVGDPGVGKTRLLEEAETLAADRGFRRLRGAGAQFEAHLSYAGLHQVLFPVLDRLGELSPAQRRSLNMALGLDGGPTPPPFEVYAAALALLAAAARSAPVIVLVDDLQWLDQASALALTFAARRLQGTKVGILATLRFDAAGAFERSGVDELEVHPLPRPAAEELLKREHHWLAPRTRQRLLDQARGNPLALLELANGLRRLPLEELERLPAVLPLTSRLESSFSLRLADLPESTRWALLLLALSSRTEDRHLLLSSTVRPADLVAAEAAGVVTVDLTTASVRFRHPLFRSAIVGRAGVQERRRAHLAIARMLAEDSPSRAWHLADAASGPDESVAALLERAAHAAGDRGDPALATEALTRAAHLTPERTQRLRRLAEAAYLRADVTGELGEADRLAAEVRRLASSGPGSLHAAVAVAFVLVNGTGDFDTAYRLIVDALEVDDRVWTGQDSELVEAITSLSIICWQAGREEYWPALYAALDRLGAAVPETLWILSQAFLDTVRTGAGVRDRLRDLLVRSDRTIDSNTLLRLTTSAVYLDLLGSCRQTLWGVVENGRSGGPLRSYLRALVQLGMDDYASGRWDEAQLIADEGEAACRAQGYRSSRWYFLYLQSLLAAVRGDLDDADRWNKELVSLTTHLKAWGAMRFGLQARTLAAQARGDWDSAYRYAVQLSPAGSFRSHTPHALWVAYDLVESAMRTGRAEDARAHHEEMLRSDIASLSPRLALLTAGAGALVAPDDGWKAAFERALATPGAEDWPFDRARIELAFGERLRRDLQTNAAHEYLHRALDTFDQLGARPWRDRARQALRASGSGASAPAEADGVPLTPQELAIAELAAEGLTNKEIAVRLFLSPRTVGGHLYTVFPKLGVSSRAALRDALAARKPTKGQSADG